MALNDNALNAAADGLAGAAVYASLHVGNPGTTGVAEVTGGNPAYARKAVSWSATGAGLRGIAQAVTFDVPGGGTTVTHFGLWSAASGGTFYGGDVLRDISNAPASEAFASQGFYQLTKATLGAVAAA